MNDSSSTRRPPPPPFWCDRLLILPGATAASSSPSWYSLAKTEAEEIALEYAKKNGLHVVAARWLCGGGGARWLCGGWGSGREALSYEVVIEGAGPAGLVAAIQLKHLCRVADADLSVCVVEKGAEVGAHYCRGMRWSPER